MYSAEKADRINHRHIGTQHLLLALLREKKFPSAKLLTQLGAHLDSLRKKVEALGDQAPFAKAAPATTYHRTVTGPEVIAIHGMKRNVGRASQSGEQSQRMLLEAKTAEATRCRNEKRRKDIFL